jgi:hypothetical protein
VESGQLFLATPSDRVSHMKLTNVSSTDYERDKGLLAKISGAQRYTHYSKYWKPLWEALAGEGKRWRLWNEGRWRGLCTNLKLTLFGTTQSIIDCKINVCI